MSIWRALRWPVAALALLFGIPAAIIVVDGLNDRVADADVGVILGTRVDPDGQPSAGLAARLEEGLALYRRGRFAMVIVSGGIGREGFDEAKVMRGWLTARGVPANAVLLDGHGDNTWATATNCAGIMQSHGWRRVLVVSQYYHISRSRLAFEKAGIGQVYTAHAHHFGLRDFWSVPREVVAYAAYLMR